MTASKDIKIVQPSLLTHLPSLETLIYLIWSQHTTSMKHLEVYLIPSAHTFTHRTILGTKESRNLRGHSLVDKKI